MSYQYHRVVRFADTDAVGVVYFANLLSMCHEAYEASLAASNIHLQTFFSNSQIIVPIVHADIDYFHPLWCGDRLIISLQTEPETPEKFHIHYQISLENEKIAAKAHTIHLGIDPATRSKQALSPEVTAWLQAHHH
jgi:1,4-dihydroxy-2-naphthoyl-CoA hydrolase